MSLDHSLAFASVALALFLGSPRSASAQVDLGTAKPFAVLGASTIASIGPTIVTGDLGLYPGIAIFGFPPGIVTGTIHGTDAVAQQAQIDSVAAYNMIVSLPFTVDLTGQDLGGLTLFPGVYRFDSSAQLTGVLTLDALGDDQAIYVFQIGSSLTTATGSTIQLINGGLASNVYWQVGSSATLGTSTTFLGNIVAIVNITLNTAATLSGRALALNGAITIDSGSVTMPPSASPCGKTPGTLTTRASLSSASTQGNDLSQAPSMSFTGRYIAFESQATNLITGDANATTDIFMRNRKTMTTTLVSRALSGASSQGTSADPTISDDGKLVAFSSDGPDLVAGDTNATGDVFVRHLKKGVDTIMSISTNGALGDGPSRSPAISGNGRFVVFVSQATNLVPGDTNGVADVFVHDRETSTTTRVSVASDGSQSNGVSGLGVTGISAKGRFVVFQSDSTNFDPASPSLGGVFLHDRKTGVTELVSMAATGASISANGRFVAFQSNQSNLVFNDINIATDVFVRDRKHGTTVRVSVDSLGAAGNGNSFSARISRDGARVAFLSNASNLVHCDGNAAADAFVHILASGITRRVSVATDGSESSGAIDLAHAPAIDRKGMRIGFASAAGDLVDGDTNIMSDVFISKK